MPSNKKELSPGAKNWIKKYFLLVDSNDIKLEFDKSGNHSLEFLHFLSNKTGLVYGIPTSLIYSNNLESSHFTKDEKLKLLLFETLLFCFKQHSKETFDSKEFLQSLNDFYAEAPSASGLDSWFSIFADKKVESKIENILAERVRVKSPIFGTNYWLNHLSNCFVFLDVILYREFLIHPKKTFFVNYTKYAKFILNGIIFAAYSDDEVEEKEQRLLWRFLTSANLPKAERDEIERLIINGITEDDLKKSIISHPILAIITYELSVFVTRGTHVINENEEEKLKYLGQLLKLNEEQMLESENLCMGFLLENQTDISLINSNSKTQFAYQSFSSRWLRILGRNKEKLVNELKESKDLIALIQKSTKQELNKEEKEQVKKQFMDILKSMPSMAIFLLPGGALLLPLILKIVPDLLPSSFKENELEK